MIVRMSDLVSMNIRIDALNMIFFSEISSTGDCGWIECENVTIKTNEPWTAIRKNEL